MHPKINSNYISQRLWLYNNIEFFSIEGLQQHVLELHQLMYHRRWKNLTAKDLGENNVNKKWQKGKSSKTSKVRTSD